MQYDLLIKNGYVVDYASAREGYFDVAVQNGMIAAVESSIGGSAVQELDASGKLVLPGLVDSHVHASAWLGGSYAHTMLVKAGVTSALDMSGPGEVFQMDSAPAGSAPYHIRGAFRAVHGVFGNRQRREYEPVWGHVPDAGVLWSRGPCREEKGGGCVRRVYCLHALYAPVCAGQLHLEGLLCRTADSRYRSSLANKTAGDPLLHCCTGRYGAKGQKWAAERDAVSPVYGLLWRLPLYHGVLSYILQRPAAAPGASVVCTGCWTGHQHLFRDSEQTEERRR